MAKRGGYIKLFRALAASEMWTKEPFTRGQAWVDLLMLANYAPGHLRVRGNRIEVSRGQVGWSAEALAKRWMWSRGKVDRFLKELQIEQQIEQQKSFLSTVLTITNYDRYQQRRAAERKADGQQTDSRTDVENSTSVRVGRKKRTAGGQQNSTEKTSADRELLSNNLNETDSRRTADDTADGHQNGALYKKKLKKKEEEVINTSAEVSVAGPTLLELPESLNSQAFRDAFSLWLAYKKERRESYKPTGLAGVLSAAAKRAERFGVQSVIDAMETARGNGWQGWDQPSLFGASHGQHASSRSITGRVGGGQRHGR